MIRRFFKKIANTSPVDYARDIKRTIVYFRCMIKSRKIFYQYFAENKVPKLQIGCGNNIMEGWLNTDYYDPGHPNIGFLDAGKKFPFKDETFQYVYSEHTFEHLTLLQGLNMISECYRVIKPNGSIRIATPDIEFLINLYEKQELPLHQEYINWATKRYCKDVSENFKESQYQAVYVINNFYRAWGHKVIYNFLSIKQILEKNYFSDVIRQKIGVSNINELKGMEKHGGIIPDKFNELETLVIEAKKQAVNV